MNLGKGKRNPFMRRKLLLWGVVFTGVLPNFVSGSTLAISGPPTKSFKATSALQMQPSSDVTLQTIETSSGSLAPYNNTTNGTTINRTCFETKSTVTPVGTTKGSFFSLTLPSYPGISDQSLFPVGATISCIGEMSDADLKKFKGMSPATPLFMPQVDFVPVGSQDTREYVSALNHQTNFNGPGKLLNSGIQWQMKGQIEGGKTLSFVAPSVKSIAGQGAWTTTLPTDWRCVVNNPADSSILVPGFFTIKGFSADAETVSLEGELWWAPISSSETSNALPQA